ncbi:SURF1 family protein [Methylobacterium gossipiicola]|uniref:SURF1-like protein n=1 Tax=Methylobacterium gossipiicola TaxID=582675 RepID=A0A1I2S4A7_9HYPH|nr:SURF1 family protein [Methylobacterium gossipiicola]SFG45667.1 surfeit locus 1 family protein [Methylobacterium gossipiicola]
MSAARFRLGAWLFGVLAAGLAAGLMALGVWQLQRRAWKHDLVARVEARLHAAPVPAPTNCRTDDCEPYRRVVAEGVLRHDRETLVQAVTEAGAGFWVVTPLVGADGRAILINRGFVPADRRDPASRAAGQVAGPLRITGLIRSTEPGGAFLRTNDPAGGRWYSRDSAAIAAARDVTLAAPYFIDADATPNPGGLPLGGLTVVAFPDNHLVYALTWFALAAMVVGAAVYALRDAARGRRRRGMP